MQNNILNKENFLEVMNDWRYMVDYHNALNDLLRKFGDGFMMQPDCSSVLLLTLETMFGDDNKTACGWINYFVYELDFGRKYEDGTIKDGDGNYIKLATVADLYELLMKEMSDNGA